MDNLLVFDYVEISFKKRSLNFNEFVDYVLKNNCTELWNTMWSRNKPICKFKIDGDEITLTYNENVGVPDKTYDWEGFYKCCEKMGMKYISFGTKFKKNKIDEVLKKIANSLETGYQLEIDDVEEYNKYAKKHN